MSEWIDNVAAVVWAGYVGEEGNLAVADVLTGKVNPSGKLTETFPVGEYDYPAHYCYSDSTVSVYSDALLVGYRYHTTAAHTQLALPIPQPRFPFGFGLSYSEFSYSDATAHITEDGVEVRFTIDNISDRDGTEIAQLYVHEVNPRVFRPYCELGAWKRVNILAHQKATSAVVLPWRAFAYYSVSEDHFLVEGGDYEIYVGTSSVDTPLRVKVRLPRKILPL